MKKLFLLDTSVLIGNPDAFEVFEDNDVAIAVATLEELDNLKNAAGDTGYSAREVIRKIFEIKNNNNVLPGGGTFSIIDGVDAVDIPGWDKNKNDNIIILTAKINNAILVTSDISMLIKAETIGVNAQIYYNKQASEESMKYKGYTDLILSDKEVADFYSANKFIPGSSEGLIVNEFLILKDGEGNEFDLGRFDGEFVVPLKYKNAKPFGVKARNTNQIFMIEACLNPDIPLVILNGTAGVGKTFCVLASALSQTMDSHIYRQTMLYKPNIAFDEEIGFLPGTEAEKLLPNYRSFHNQLETLLGNKEDNPDDVQSKIDYIMEKGWLKEEALMFLRGQSISNSFIVLDEAQNAVPGMASTIITRCGEGSKMVIMGDASGQIDNSRCDAQNNLLSFVYDRMRGSKLCAELTFDPEDCVRSPLAKEASERLIIKKR